jgi:hypothetical protein
MDRLKDTFRKAELTWREPFAFRIRLRGDFPARVLIIAGSWLIGTGLLFVLLWLTQNPATHLTVFGLGLIPGLCTLAGMIMMRSQASGGVDLHKDEIRRSTISYAVVAMRTTDERWELAGIESCTIVPGEEIGQSFAVMILRGDEFEDLIAIPRKTSARQVAKFLHDQGVELKKGTRLPKSATSPIPNTIGAVLVLVGAAILGVGLWLNSGAGPVNLNPLREPPAFFRPAPPPAVIPANPIIIPGNQQPGVVVPSVLAPLSIQELTPVIGGAGGFPFKKADVQGRPVLGVRYILSDWAGKKRVSLLTPVFTTSSGEALGTVSARDGYALGAIHVSVSEFVDGVTLKFMKLKEDGSLDRNDTYRSEPIGAMSENPKVISGDGRRVVGIHGRGGAVMDAVGLVLSGT